MRIIVDVPATCANLGSGFDVFGAAIELKNRFIVDAVNSSGSDKILYKNLYTRNLKVAATGNQGSRRLQPAPILSIEPDDGIIPKDKTNLFYRALVSAYKKFSGGKKMMPGLKIRIIRAVPGTSGLGSSASAVIAGTFCAAIISGKKFGKKEILKLVADEAVKYEGHPDNVIPALYGGLCISYRNNEKEYCYEKIEMPDDLTAVIVHPAAQKLSTSYARAALPVKIPLQDAVFNISRAALFIEAVRGGKYHLLKKSMEDRIHQVRRGRLYPGCLNLIEALYELGALGAAISGSGPSVIGIFAKKMLTEKTKNNIKERFKDGKTGVYILPFRNTGTEFRLRDYRGSRRL